MMVKAGVVKRAVLFASDVKNGQYEIFNGAYQNGTIYVDINAGKLNSADNRRMILQTFAHELTHSLEGTEAYKELEKFVLNHIGEEQLAEIKQRLMKTGMYSEEELQQEIVANACAEVLYDSTAIQAMAKENRTLYERVREFIRGLINKIRQVYQQENSFRQESVLMRDVSEKLAELWDTALLENLNQQNSSSDQADVKHMYREGSIERNELDAGITAVAGMSAVSSLKGYEVSLKASDIVRTIGEYYESLGGVVENPQLGDVTLSKRGIKADLAHGIGREKAAAFVAVPDILQQGQVVDYQTNWKGRGYDTAVVAAPIKIDGTEYMAGVLLKRTNSENKFYIHEVLAIKKETSPFNQAALLFGDVDSGGDIPSINKILQRIVGVNAEVSERLSEVSGDDEAAQRILLEQQGAQYSARVTDDETKTWLEGLGEQDLIHTYRSMQLIDGELYPPMAAVVAGSKEDASELGSWEMAMEHPELIKFDKKTGKAKFTLNKGEGQGSLDAAYNPYMHSSNLMLNDQFTGAYKRGNLVTVECVVPASENTSGYQAEYAKDNTGWHDWHAGPVASHLSEQRQVFLSRWLKPVRILSDAEVAQEYQRLLEGTNISVPYNVVTPSLLSELEKIGVPVNNNGSGNVPVRQTEFSMREPVEQVGNLLALHNLTEQNLLDTIRLGGFPMPSIAVVKADAGHSKYGPISVVLPSDSIDPETDSRNHVYGGDAWTPTAPNVEYPVNSKRSQQVEQILDQRAKKVAGGIFGNTSVLRSAGIEDSSTMSAEELANRLADNDTVRAAYLADQGETLEPVLADKVWNRKFGNDVLNTIIDRIGVQDLAGIKAQLELGESIETALGEHRETLNDILHEYYKKLGEPLLRKMAVAKKWTAEEISEKREARIANSMDKLSVFSLEDLIRNAWDMYQDGGQTRGEIDRMATRDALQAKTDRTKVKQWLQGQLDGLLGEPGIYNGKDRFTASGNRRSFASLHYAYTAENIVRAMTQNQRQRGEGVWGHDSKAMMSTATPEYSNIDSIRSDSGRLQQIDEQEYNDLLSDLDEDIDAVIKQVRKQNKPHSDNSYEEEDIIGGILIDAATGKQTPAAIVRAFSKEGYTIDKDTAKRIQALYHTAAEMPTGYFEAKPERVVNFNEALAVVVPDNANETLLQQIQSTGMPMRTYATGDEQSRLQAVNAVEGAKFSARDSEGNQLTDAQQQYFADSVVRDDDGNLMVMYHGRVSEFTVFDHAFANPEGDMGAGFYFTSNETDANRNYGDENGADLEGKIDALSDRLLLSGLYDPNEVWAEARKRLITAEPNTLATLAVYLNVQNPVILGGENETFFEYEEAYDEAADEYGEPEGTLVDFIRAIETILADGEYSDDQADLSQLYELGYDGGGSAANVISVANEALMYVEDDEGRLVSKEIIRRAFEQIGFDGIVDHTVSNKWGADSMRVSKMEGVDSDTFHCIVFDSNQVKLITNQEPTDNEDIRYSIRETDDGMQFVHIDVDQARFNGLTTAEMAKEAGQVLREKFQGKTIGGDYAAYVGSTSVKEFTHPANRRMKQNIKEAKFRTSPELDRLLEVSTYLGNEQDDGRHPQATGGFDKFQTYFVVGGHAYEGVISIMVMEDHNLFYDVTKIKDITRSTTGLAMTAVSGSPSDVSTTENNTKSDSVNPQFSQRVYAVTDDEILSNLDTAKLTTQAEREAYFRWERRRSQYQNWQNKVDELQREYDSIEDKDSGRARNISAQLSQYMPQIDNAMQRAEEALSKSKALQDVLVRERADRLLSDTKGKLSDQQRQDLVSLRNEANRLRKKLAEQRRQSTRTDAENVQLNQSEIRQLAERLVDGTSVSSRDVMYELSNLVTAVAKSGSIDSELVSWNEIYDMANNVADQIANSYQVSISELDSALGSLTGKT